MSFDNTVLLEVGLSVALFTGIVLVLVAVILVARSRLVAEGSVKVTINGEREVQLPVGVKLLNGLIKANVGNAAAAWAGSECGWGGFSYASVAELWLNGQFVPVFPHVRGPSGGIDPSCFD